MSDWVYDNDSEEWPPMRLGEAGGEIMSISKDTNNRDFYEENTTQQQREPELKPFFCRKSFTVVSLLSLFCAVLLGGIIALGLQALMLHQKHQQLHKEKLELGDFCRDGCRSHNQSFYYISTGTKTWEQSRQNCRDKGADLIIIDSREEQEFLNSQNQYYWIGLSGRDEAGMWKWVDGSILNTSKLWVRWDSQVRPQSKNCIISFEYRSTPHWENHDCQKYSRWICEKTRA